MMGASGASQASIQERPLELRCAQLAIPPHPFACPGA